MTSRIHKNPQGRLIEYRRNPYDPGVLFLQSRVLKPDGTPYDDQWFRVSDAHLLNLQRQPGGQEVIDWVWANPDNAKAEAESITALHGNLDEYAGD